MKGIIYYNLLREFCQPWSDAKAGELPGIPVVESFGINDKPLRGTIRQTYDYAKAQLDKALALNPTDPKYLFTEWIIKAYKVKLEFWCQNWDSVVSLCEDIIARGGVSLTPISEYAGMINAQYDLGFGSVDGYQRAFQREFGCNPGQYARTKVPIPLFIPYGVQYREQRKETVSMEQLQSLFVQLVRKRNPQPPRVR